ncbi:transposase [Mycobacterium marinum]|uniref:transposase n=1 Tax=Mycobacterium marinum TaxID=1781 RepID=UPI002359A223|nr:transposase [Mycobacterium marinum]WCS16651.1 transposase [Mycobacterium marinum]
MPETRHTAIGRPNFAVTALVEQIARAHANLLIRCKDTRVLPPIKMLPDRTWLARMGAVTVRVIDARISVRLDGGATRCGHYRLITTLIDEKRYPADELVRLYHQRWEIETSYLELKSTILGDECCARPPAGITQEVYALLITYQALRTAIADTSLAHPTISPDRLSFTIALHAARDQVVHAAAAITATTARSDRPHRSGPTQPATTSSAITLKPPSSQACHLQAPGQRHHRPHQLLNRHHHRNPRRLTTQHQR